MPFIFAANAHEMFPQDTMTQVERLQLLLADGSVRRAHDIRAAGIRQQAIADALGRGMIVRAGVGSYLTAELSAATGPVGVAAIAARMDKAVVCLATAAHLLGLLDALSTQVWVALPVGAYDAKRGAFPHQTVRWSQPSAFTVGVEVKQIRGVHVRITGAPRTIVDLIRYGTRIGAPVAGVQAARRFVQKGGSFEEVLHVAADLGVPAAVARKLDLLCGALG